MIPSSSPSPTSSETSATIVAPPMSSPSERMARREPSLTPLLAYGNDFTGGWTLPGEITLITLGVYFLFFSTSWT
jgi:hypothetical protein